MLSIDRLNKYPPGTEGYVLVAHRRHMYHWVEGIILGRINGMRRVRIAKHEYVFIEHEQQFQLTKPWSGQKTRNANFI